MFQYIVLTCEAIKDERTLLFPFFFFLSFLYDKLRYWRRRWNNRIMTCQRFTQRGRRKQNEAIEMSIQFGFVGFAWVFRWMRQQSENLLFISCVLVHEAVKRENKRKISSFYALSFEGGFWKMFCHLFDCLMAWQTFT